MLFGETHARDLGPFGVEWFVCRCCDEAWVIVSIGPVVVSIDRQAPRVRVWGLAEPHYSLGEMLRLALGRPVD